MANYISKRVKNLPNYKSAEVKFKDLEKAKKFIGKKGTVEQVYKNGKRKLVYSLPEVTLETKKE
ncbi:hypothetical protein ACFSKN_02105 [Mariniflexile gromovii]|uniref:Uncharacterized protein n=1 Tax=Mariniflexile gromovii TaxID=362523 RepID=A0ABS4BQP4_9FLAO|nr:hypothetical protein [Mariniflexile gromovii]MBP0902395.1 hypothetical protein [Mariniflexile gromovii]